ncbi:MAG: GrpB family protein [Bacteroidota bacterium]
MLIQPYTPSWPQKFKQLKEILLRNIPVPATLEHIGSTSVPELPAKDIIDMDLVYDKEQDFTPIKTHLEGLGYYHKGDQGIPQREAFKRHAPQMLQFPLLDTIPHHLYVCPQGSPELYRHLTFRNYLRKNKEARLAYSKLKQEIAYKANQDKKLYAQIKEKAARSFVEAILEKARKEDHL